jgi:peptide/nickel transport system substrate-binding protein
MLQGIDKDLIRNRRKGFKRTLITSVVVLTTLFLLGCGTSEEPQTTSPAVAKARVGGTIVMSLNHPQSLNPILNPVSTTIFTSPLFFNGLTKPGDDMESLPDLAKSWDVSADGLSYTFALRDDVKWHDGQDFTSQDVRFSWEATCHPDNVRGRQICGFFGRVKGVPAYLAGEANEISGLSLPNAHTVQVEMTEVFAPFLTISAGQMILPNHVWKDVPVKEMAAHPASRGVGTIGTGPFKVESWTANESIVLSANESYYDGRPNLDGLTLRQTSQAPPDQAARVSQLKVGEVQAMGLYASLPIDNVAEIEADPNNQVRSVVGLANQYVEFNVRHPIFQDVRMRKAVSYATDRTSLQEGLWSGKASFVNGPIHPVHAWAINPDTPLFDNDVDKARELFAEAGWTPGSDGILQKDGEKLTIPLQGCCGLATYGPVLQQQWKRAGIDVQLESMDFGSFWGPIYLSRKHVMAGLNLPYGLYTDPEYPMGGYFTPGLNRSGWDNPRGKELIRLATATLDQGQRQQHYYELQELMANDVPNLWLGIPDEYWAYSKNLFIPEKKTGYLTIRAAKDWYLIN